MAYETISNKKFLNSEGVGHLWTKIRQRYDSKLSEVTAGNDAISVANNNQVSVVISSEEDNLLKLKTTGNKGLYVKALSSDLYEIAKDDESSDYAAVYRLKRYAGGSGTPVDAGVAINIPKDMVVQSGLVVEKTTSGDWGDAGTYIELTLANSNNTKLYIPVGSLIEYVTSGSQVGDMVVINIDPTTHEVTAAISDGTITKAKLTQALQNALDTAESAVQSVTTGSTNGTINVDGTAVSVFGLGTAAYTDATAYDPAGSADAVLGTANDAASVITVYGVKQYASDAYAAIQALTNAEIDGAISVANNVIDA